ncbi:iron-siderophore ABC transporter substrate-binding protein [Kribbella sp. NPDC051770]|uniref:iron-siderophore ABC transporter substrate-binding protein n=1 Tax=Kribbella sp. NPDC051770 TaxID=3155413 RepID=UPI003445B97E
MATLAPTTDLEFSALVDELTRRGFLAGGRSTAALFGLAACGDDDKPSADAPAAAAPVAHKYGTTTPPTRPQRVVSLGYTDHEPLLALGVRPVGVVDFFGERPYGNWLWETPLWDGSKPEIVGERDEYQYEKIAALRPDLIVGLYSGMTRQNYDTLSKLAPVVAQPRDYADFAGPWTVMTKLAGQAVGRTAEADKLVAGITVQFAKARQAHPEWAGKTVAKVEPAKADEWAVFGAADPKLQFFEGLGFTVAPAVLKLEPGGDVATLSLERLDLLEVDQLVVLIDTGDQTEQQVRANPIFDKLAVARENRTLYLPFSAAPATGAALAFNSVLSIPFGIDQVVTALTR